MNGIFFQNFKLWNFIEFSKIPKNQPLSWFGSFFKSTVRKHNNNIDNSIIFYLYTHVTHGTLKRNKLIFKIKTVTTMLAADSTFFVFHGLMCTR